MTFEGEYRSNPYTQDVSKAKDNRTFQQSPMMRIEHEDPGLHYIGESLPKPGETEATWAGRYTSVGTSPIPARADHSHDTFLRYSVGGHLGASTITTAPSGQTLIKHGHIGGENYYAGGSQTLLLIPQEGVWFINTSLGIERSGGGTYTGEVNIVFYYLNGGFSRIVFRDSMVNIPIYKYINVSDYVHYGASSIGVNSTFEMAYQHNDSVNHIITVSQLTLTRMAAI